MKICVRKCKEISGQNTAVNGMILWMEEILHHLGTYKQWDKRINHLSAGAGFLPSTVVALRT